MGGGSREKIVLTQRGITLKMERNNCSSETAEIAEEKSKCMLPLVALAFAFLWSLILVFLSCSKPLLPGNQYVEVLTICSSTPVLCAPSPISTLITALWVLHGSDWVPWLISVLNCLCYHLKFPLFFTLLKWHTSIPKALTILSLQNVWMS